MVNEEGGDINDQPPVASADRPPRPGLQSARISGLPQAQMDAMLTGSTCILIQSAPGEAVGPPPHCPLPMLPLAVHLLAGTHDGGHCLTSDRPTPSLALSDRQIEPRAASVPPDARRRGTGRLPGRPRKNSSGPFLTPRPVELAALEAQEHPL
jgi:hypothetical protein